MDIKYENLTGIVEYLYRGEVSVEEDKVTEFLQAAETLGVRSLTEDKKEDEKKDEKDKKDKKKEKKPE